MSEQLFTKYDWFSVEENQLKKLRDAINSYDDNKLLNTSTEDLCKYFFESFSVNVPDLKTDKITAEQTETQVDISRDPYRHVIDRSRPAYIAGTEVTITVPFKGDGELFNVRPTTFSLSPPRAILGMTNLQFKYKGVSLDAGRVRTQFDQDLQEITGYLRRLQGNVQGLHVKIHQIAKEEIEIRKQKLLANQSLVANIGFPLKQRPDTPQTYVAPDVRRTIRPTPPVASTAPYKPEPILSDSDYQHILNVINNMALVMERSPSAFKSLDEEALRSHFLVQLNGHFEGAATGETFNYSGKTDILIRVEGRNIFIGECKFWGGPKKLTETIDQLLNYTSWRDTKTAILIFNKNKKFSGVVDAVHDVALSHPNFKKDLGKNSESTFKYLFFHKDDKNQEMILTIMAFDVPS